MFSYILKPLLQLPNTYYVYTFKFFVADAMAIVRHYGKPDLFITMTASADWAEIIESLFPGETSMDRPDVVSRVFHMKAKEFIKDIEDGGVLGRVIAILAVVEWQKRGIYFMHVIESNNQVSDICKEKFDILELNYKLGYP